jgi:hypothetical protein
MDMSDQGLPKIRDLADEYAREHGWDDRDEFRSML